MLKTMRTTIANLLFACLLLPASMVFSMETAEPTASQQKAGNEKVTKEDTATDEPNKSPSLQSKLDDQQQRLQNIIIKQFIDLIILPAGMRQG